MTLEILRFTGIEITGKNEYLSTSVITSIIKVLNLWSTIHIEGYVDYSYDTDYSEFYGVFTEKSGAMAFKLKWL